MGSIQKHEIARARLLVAGSGGDIEAVDADGEVHWVIGLAPGVHAAAEYGQYLPPGCYIQAGGGVTVVRDHRRRVQTAPVPEVETGANPDFRPRLATPDELRLRRLADVAEEKLRRAQMLLERDRTVPQHVAQDPPPAGEQAGGDGEPAALAGGEPEGGTLE